jgi:hypothetical protein
MRNSSIVVTLRFVGSGMLWERWGDLRARDHSEDPGVDGRKILK